MMRVTLPGPRSPMSRVRIMADDRFSSLCHRWSAACTSTMPSGCSRTLVTRVRASPTATRHATSSLPCDIGPCRNSSVSARGTTE